jgi:hypothetical protein
MYGFDHKNSEKLFFRRITTICSAGNPSQQFKYAEKNYVNQMKPLLIAMKYAGLLPISISKSGKINVRYSIEELVDKGDMSLHILANYNLLYVKRPRKIIFKFWCKKNDECSSASLK